MRRHGWVLLFHDCIIGQLKTLQAAAARAERNDPQNFERNANVKLFRAVSQLILETVLSDPARDDYRQGNTLGSAYRHWRRAKIGRRFRLFFRYDSQAKIIVFAWVNDGQPLRAAQAASPTPMPGSRRCSKAEIRLTTGKVWLPRASRIGRNKDQLAHSGHPAVVIAASGMCAGG